MVDGLREILERNRKSPPKRAFLARIFLGAGKEAPYRLSELYALALDLGQEQPGYDNILETSTSSFPNAAQLWVSGQLSDIVSEGFLPEREREVIDEIRRRGINVAAYHPTSATSKRVREQFFARVAVLDDLTVDFYGSKIPVIGRSKRDIYESEIARRIEVEPYARAA